MPDDNRTPAAGTTAAETPTVAPDTSDHSMLSMDVGTAGETLLEIDHVTLRFGGVVALNDVDFSLAWPSISKSLGATGHFVWHGEKLDASVTLADFAAALAGNRTGVKLRLNGAPMNAAFEGAFSFKPTLKVEGTLAADAASLRRTLTWAGHEPLPGGGFGRFAIKAQTSIVGDTISLAGVNVELDGNSAEGVLSFANEGRQTLQGTLAAETLNLSPYISTVRLLASNQRAWDESRLTPDGLNGMDFDLRVSAANGNEKTVGVRMTIAGLVPKKLAPKRKESAF